MSFFNGVSGIKMRIVVTALILLSNLQPAAATTISLDKTIDTLDRTLAYQGEIYDIRDIGAYSLGETVNITVNATDVESFQLSLLDKNKNFLWNHMVYYTDGMAEAVMPGGAVTVPGTYVFAVFYQGDILAVKPVVISKYNLSVIPSSTIVPAGGTLHVKVRVSPDTSLPVRVVLVKNSSSLESSANRTQDGIYETDINIPESAYSRFSLYAAIASDNIILGYPELIGISGEGTINVTELSPQAPTAAGYILPAVAFLFLTGVIFLVLRKIRS
ncbi:exported hypothetical protein [Candidatus Methanoperedens nitroreducens]|uniref:Uncharacterized protein n=2 Tax=Candidatus Methanoperedens nitratireducens TaxID=1392998 RepID=A0A284VP66_9EURY|nr:exported hypothetical protein [Candidatus Methanoperedens nitroreducens]